MKIRKSATQKNFKVSTWYYSYFAYCSLAYIDGVEYLDDKLVVFADYVDQIKVVLDEFGFYINVVVMKTGEKIFVEL